MGAQQVKSDGQFLFQECRQHLMPEKCAESVVSLPVVHGLINEIPMDTVISNQDLRPNSITVADFAKIKTVEQTPKKCFEKLVDENNSQFELLKERVKCQDVVPSVYNGEYLESEGMISSSTTEEASQELEALHSTVKISNLSDIEVKKELIETSNADSTLKTVEDFASFQYYTVISQEYGQYLMPENCTENMTETEDQTTRECFNDHAQVVVENNNSQLESLMPSVKSEVIDHSVPSKEFLNSDIMTFSPNTEAASHELNAVHGMAECSNLRDIEIKNEVLEIPSVDSTIKIVNDAASCPNSKAVTYDECNSKKSPGFGSAIKIEKTNDTQSTEICDNENIHAEIANLKENHLKFVRNPFAFLKVKCVLEKDHAFIGNTYQKNILNNSMETDDIPIKEELECSGNSQPALKEENTESSTNPNELIIKSENINTSEVNQQIYDIGNLNNDSLCCNLNSLLDVEASNNNAVLNEAKYDTESRISISSTTSACLEHFSTIDVSSVKDDDLPDYKLQLAINTEIPKNQGSNKSNSTRPYKLRRRRKLRNSYQEKRQMPINNRAFNTRTVAKKRNIKTNQPKKQTKKDYKYKSKNTKRKSLKMLPKTDIRTRKKPNKLVASNKAIKNGFPKPFKLEPASVTQKDHSIALELPKPIMFKTDFDINIRNKMSYLKPKFQPYVRLRRLKSEDLSVSLRERHVCKHTGTMNAFKGGISHNQNESDNKNDFRIQKAFSLNPYNRYNRLSIDRDYSHCKDQSSSYSPLITTPNHSPMVSLPSLESKYFTDHELFSLFHSTNSNSSMAGDSGASTSTPRMPADSNQILLLQIAAERAFINNHLNHFGYSTIHFDLYNDLNDLIVFLKYLFGNVNTN